MVGQADVAREQPCSQPVVALRRMTAVVQAMAEATAARKPAFGRRDPKPWSGMVAGRVQACINHLVGRTWTAHQAGIDSRLGRVDIHSRRPMEALPPRLALDVPANLAPLVRLRTVFLAASTHSVCMPPTKQIFHSCITASLGGTSVLSGACA